MKLILKLTAILLVCALTITSCNNITVGDSTDISTDGIITLYNPEEELKPYPVTLNNVEITEAPKKVVSLSPALTEIMHELGYGGKLVGRSEYCDYPKAVSALPSLGSGAKPDIDKIIKLKPSLVISATAIANKDIVNMEKNGIKTLVISAPTSIDGLKSVYEILGLAFEGLFTGKEKGAEKFNAIEKSVAAAKKTEKNKFIYITTTMAVAGGDTLESNVLSLFGENIAKTGKGYTYELEKLLENQPDIIFLNNDYELADLEEDEIFSQLTAVQNGKVYSINNTFFERPTGRITNLLKEFTVKFAPAETSPQSTSSKVIVNSSAFEETTVAD